MARRAAPGEPAVGATSIDDRSAATGLAAAIEGLLGPIPVAIECYDGSRAGPTDSPATIVVRSRDTLRRVLAAPGELGLSRAFVAGDIAIEGDIFAVAAFNDHLGAVRPLGRRWVSILRQAGPGALRRLRPPPEEARLAGRRHSPGRDAAAIAHHYDLSNEFYRLMLGPSMTYSCGVWPDTDASLEEAQAAKYELVCRKLGLRPGMRLLDVGCGWGGMVMHAARYHGAEAVGVTLSGRQAEWATRAVAAAGLSDQVQIRIEDYRRVGDGPFDAISSIGMFEHVGFDRLGEYFTRLRTLLRPGGRLLNHGISRPPGKPARFPRRSFMNRYVFPDGELHEVGAVLSMMQAAGYEARHLESLREHYALTLRAWVANLEGSWEEAVALVGDARARIWHLYMAGAALRFEAGRIQVNQILAVRGDAGESGLPLRPDWDSTPLIQTGPP